MEDYLNVDDSTEVTLALTDAGIIQEVLTSHASTSRGPEIDWSDDEDDDAKLPVAILQNVWQVRWKTYLLQF